MSDNTTENTNWGISLSLKGEAHNYEFEGNFSIAGLKKAMKKVYEMLIVDTVKADDHLRKQMVYHINLKALMLGATIEVVSGIMVQAKWLGPKKVEEKKVEEKKVAVKKAAKVVKPVKKVVKPVKKVVKPVKKAVKPVKKVEKVVPSYVIRKNMEKDLRLLSTDDLCLLIQSVAAEIRRRRR